MVHNLLCDQLLSWRDLQRRRATATLPGLLARLGDGTLGDFPRVRPHQFHPWCMFLTQLAAIALHRAGEGDPAQSEDRWRALLLGLTNGRHEPWALVVEDLAQPAFFQPPVPEGRIDAWATCSAPDDVDVLVTSKNHDVKTSQLDGTNPEYWAYAITTLQTMQGYPGRGYNGIARMHGGYGNRPRVGLASGQTPSARFARDVEVLLGQWAALLDRGYADRGVGLVWTEPWDGRASLAMEGLSPHFIEVCWRLRLETTGERLCARYTTTSARRCLNHVKTGDVGDAWIPVKRQDRAALTVGSNGFDYRLLTRVLFEGDFEPAAAQVPLPSDADSMLFAAYALARGQGKTEGLQERYVPLPKQIRFKLGVPAERASLAARAAARVIEAALMRDKVLRPALGRLRAGSPGRDDFDARVDEVFFEDLFTTADREDDDARLLFGQRLRDIAWRELQAAISRSGLTGTHQLRDISSAEHVFASCLSKHFPDLTTTTATSPRGAEA